MGDTSFHFTGPVAPNSPDMNSIGYKVWVEMQKRLHQMKVHDADNKLKQCMLCLARGLVEQTVINDAMGGPNISVCVFINVE